MSSSEPPLVYLILGAAGSGRRLVLADLLGEGIAADERAVVLLSDNEAPQEVDGRLGNVGRWSLHGDTLAVPRETYENATHVFWVTDGRGSPIDQLEAFKAWLPLSGCEVGRVITVVNCRLAEQHPKLVAWYEACIHFSDVVLLAHREGVPNKWLSDFQNRFKDLFYPCIFEFVKDGRVKNPPLILEPEARRMSHLFDEPDWEILDDEDEDEKDTEGTDEVEVKEEVDPYFERWVSGRRVKELPDIAKFLDGEVVIPPPPA